MTREHLDPRVGERIRDAREAAQEADSTKTQKWLARGLGREYWISRFLKGKAPAPIGKSVEGILAEIAEKLGTTKEELEDFSPRHAASTRDSELGTTSVELEKSPPRQSASIRDSGLDYLLNRHAGEAPKEPCKAVVRSPATIQALDFGNQLAIGGFSTAIDAAIRKISELGPGGPGRRITLLGDTKGIGEHDWDRSVKWARVLQCAMDRGWPVQHFLYRRDPDKEFVAHWLVDRLGFPGQYDLSLSKQEVAVPLGGIVLHTVGAFLFLADRDNLKVFRRAIYAPINSPLYDGLHEHAHGLMKANESTEILIEHRDNPKGMARLDGLVLRHESNSKAPVIIVKRGLCLALEAPVVLRARALRAISQAPAKQDTISRIVAQRQQRRRHFTTSQGKLQLLSTEEAFKSYAMSGSISTNTDDEIEMISSSSKARKPERRVVLRAYRKLIADGRVKLFFGDGAELPIDAVFQSIHWDITDERVAFATFRPGLAMHE